MSRLLKTLFRPRNILTMLLAVSAFTLLVPCSVSASATWTRRLARQESAAQPPFERLESGITIEREVSGTETHHYVVPLNANDYARIFVEQRAVDVVVKVFAPNGATLKVDRPNGTRGIESISVVARETGNYKIEITALQKRSARGAYRVRFDEQRPATSRDESRLAAEQAVTEGAEAWGAKTAASLRDSTLKFNQAVALWRALDEPYEEAVALYGLCFTERLAGDAENSVASCTASLKLMRELKNAPGQAAALTARGWSYLVIGQSNQAAQDFQATLLLHESAQDNLRDSIALYGAGWANALEGRHAEAIELIKKSIAMRRELGEGTGIAIRLAALGDVYRRMENYTEASRYLEEALRLMPVENDRGTEGETLANLAWVYLMQDKHDAAAEAFNRSLTLRRATGDRHGEAISLYGIARVEAARNNFDIARTHNEAAIKIVEDLRSGVASRAFRLSFFAIAQDYYGFQINLLMQMHRINPDKDYAARAFEWSEHARARELLDSLNLTPQEIGTNISPELIAREKDLRARLEAAVNFQNQLLSDRFNARQAESARKEVEDLTAQLNLLEIEISRANPRYMQLTKPRITTADEARALLDDDTVLLEFYIGRHRSFLWTLTRRTLNVYELPTRDTLAPLARELRDSFTARNRTLKNETAAQRKSRIENADLKAVTLAAQLSNILLAPAARELNKSRLIIAANSILQAVPFAALPSPNAQSPSASSSSVKSSPGKPLLTRHEITLLPSVSTLALLRREAANRPRPPLTLALYADPVFARDDERLDTKSRTKRTISTVNPPTGEPTSSNSLPRLSRTSWEADRIAAMLPVRETSKRTDFAANLTSATTANLNSFRILHFATHALVDDEHPELSGIALSLYNEQGQPQNGILRLHHIYNLRLNADLVFLSACRTALGRDYLGEGIVGLTRAFLQTGSPRVIGSLWSTDDKAASELSVRFYKHLFTHNLAPSAALRAAQLELTQDERWNAPYYWAAFTLQGDWQAMKPMSRSKPVKDE